MDISKVSKEFAEDLIGLINSCKNVTYNAEVDFVNKKGQRTHFKYVTLDKMYAIVKENPNFALLEPLGTNEQGRPAVQIILIHKSGEALTSDYYELALPASGSKQDEGSAITYTKRYALGSFLSISTDEDNDAGTGNGGMEIRKPNVNQKAQSVNWKEQFIKMCILRKLDYVTIAAANGFTKEGTTQAQYQAVCKQIEEGVYDE